jgi:hypothetical protein
VYVLVIVSVLLTALPMNVIQIVRVQIVRLRVSARVSAIVIVVAIVIPSVLVVMNVDLNNVLVIVLVELVMIVPLVDKKGVCKNDNKNNFNFC